MFYSSLCKHGPARQNVGASASGVQLGRTGIVARRLVRVIQKTRTVIYIAVLIKSMSDYVVAELKITKANCNMCSLHLI